MTIESVTIEAPAETPAVKEPHLDLDGAINFIDGNIAAARQAALMRQQLSDQLRSGGEDAEWRKLGIMLTRDQRREQSDANRRIAQKCREDLAKFEAVKAHLLKHKESV